jgi:2-polyprenyl-3-methyl-5-hydroxy-6-metoxy-1,4-benzoquinol methylase
MKDEIVKHYEEKYAAERSSESIELIPCRKYPENRSESCVKYFADHFDREGDILELGAGNGAVANSILQQNKRINRYIISDLSENRLKGVKQSIKDERLSIIRIDVEEFDFGSIEKVDAVIMIALIEHLIDPLGTMKRIKGVLKPGGFVYIDTPNIADYGARFKLLTGRFPSTASKKEGTLRYDNTPVTLYDEGHLHYFTYNSLSTMLKKYCGFEETTKYHQMIGKRFLGKRIHYQLAKMWPEMFSSLILIAR